MRSSTCLRKPSWLKVNLCNTEKYADVNTLVAKNMVNTICVSAKCPNQGDCWSRGTASFLIGGDICTRNCHFCNTKSGKPMPLDAKEPARVADTVSYLNLKHVVITSVDRDDLNDLGVNHWIRTIRAIRAQNHSITMEVLIPDFQGRRDCLDLIIGEHPEVVSHNIETVRRLTPSVRSVAEYERSLQVLGYLSSCGIYVKSGLMLGLGESIQEVEQAMDDLLAVGCKALTLGQYLQPSKNHIPVVRYLSPQEFELLRLTALSKGFEKVVSGVLVRSSYRADELLKH